MTQRKKIRLCLSFAIRAGNRRTTKEWADELNVKRAMVQRMVKAEKLSDAISARYPRRRALIARMALAMRQGKKKTLDEWSLACNLRPQTISQIADIECLKSAICRKLPTRKEPPCPPN